MPRPDARPRVRLTERAERALGTPRPFLDEVLLRLRTELPGCSLVLEPTADPAEWRGSVAWGET